MGRYDFSELKVRDAFRAQYFLNSIEEAIAKAEIVLEGLNVFSSPFPRAIHSLCENLLDELDRVILPTLTFEINKSGYKGELYGRSPVQRYESFFVDGAKYTHHALAILTRYPFLFKIADKLIQQTFDSFITCIKRYSENQVELKKWLQISPNDHIQHISPLNGADRHASQQALLFTFSSGKRVIYKPVDLRPDLLATQFVKNLNLTTPFNLKTLEVLPKESFGWIKFVEQKKCQNSHEIETFYRRAGVLLAVADCLNFTDGHFENLIACGPFPLLLDGETFFQNYEQTVIENKSILTTLLIQKVNTKEKTLLNSAFQAPGGKKFEYLQTHAINDHTDKIQIRYHKISNSLHRHCPTLGKKSCKSYNYVSFIIEGYRTGYRQISKKLESIINDEKWWEALEKIKARILLRPTLSYLYLIRKMQQPDVIISEKKAETVLLKKLGETPYSCYEVQDLLSLNIPYFYHFPGQKDLFDARGQRYPNVFSDSAIERLKKQFLQRSEDKMELDCTILSRHLVPTF